MPNIADLRTPGTYEGFSKSDRRISAFRESRRAMTCVFLILAAGVNIDADAADDDVPEGFVEAKLKEGCPDDIVQLFAQSRQRRLDRFRRLSVNSENLTDRLKQVKSLKRKKAEREKLVSEIKIQIEQTEREMSAVLNTPFLPESLDEIAPRESEMPLKIGMVFHQGSRLPVEQLLEGSGVVAIIRGTYINQGTKQVATREARVFFPVDTTPLTEATKSVPCPAALRVTGKRTFRTVLGAQRTVFEVQEFRPQDFLD